MSLLQCLPYKEYKQALQFSAEQCERIAKLAELNISFTNTNNPGEILMRALDRCGCSLDRYKELLATFHTKTVIIYYKPRSKVAILIANDRYLYLSKLATPSVDCDSLGDKLKQLGFIVIVIKNTASKVLKEILEKIIDIVPEDSYCFIFYAGHGCQLCNTKCMLGIDCPVTNIEIDNCVTENYILKKIERCKLDLCIFVMDMCTIYLDRSSNPAIYSSISTIDDYSIHKNLIITCSAQSSQSAYEVLQIECSTSIANDVTYELKTGDTMKIVPGASLYVNALCMRILDDLPVSELMDLVHSDVEQSVKKQRPIKLQCGTEKRSLYDPVSGDTSLLLCKLKEIIEYFKDYANVY